MTAVFMTVSLAAGSRCYFLKNKDKYVLLSAIPTKDIEAISVTKNHDLLVTVHRDIPHLPPCPPHQFSPSDSEHPNPYFMSGSELQLFLEDLVRNHPDATLSSIGFSWEKRAILSLRVGTPGKPVVFVIGLHHAREWISMEFVAHFAAFLLENRQNNAHIDKLLRSVDIHCIPLLNPDGYFFSQNQERMWRKNRHRFSDGELGVDLNRNYDASWVPAQHHLHGDAPFSEPETSAIRQAARHVIAQNNTIAALLSYHSYGQLILYPPGSRAETYSYNEIQISTTRTMTDIIRGECGRSYDIKQIFQLYQVNGCASEWFAEAMGVPYSFTVELPPTPKDPQGFKLLAVDIASVIREQTAAALYVIQRAVSHKDVSYDSNNDGTPDWYENTPWEDTVCDSENYGISHDDDTARNDADTVELSDEQGTDGESEETDPDRDNTAGSGCALTLLSD